MNKLIINFTPTGIIPDRQMTPHVPVSPDEIVAEVLGARQYGVSMVHLHARDEQGNPTHRRDVYAEIIRGIRRVDRDIILCVSTSGRVWNEFEKRAECLTLEGGLKPDMASLTLSSLNFNHEASINPPDMIRMLAQRMKDTGIKPELEAFDSGMINYAKYLHSKGILEPPFYFNLILGNIACAQPNPLHLGVMINDLPAQSLWAAGGVGDAQLPMNLCAMACGGGVRVGIEDNIWLTPRRDRLASNAELLGRIQSVAVSMGKEIARPCEVREWLGIPRGRQ